MVWRLKNRELESRILDIDPDFIENSTKAFESNSDDFVRTNIEYDGETIGTLSIRREEYQEIPEYDPKKWNKYPITTPPAHIPMRVEFGDKFGAKAFYDDDYGCFRQYSTAKRLAGIVRFRPWDD